MRCHTGSNWSALIGVLSVERSGLCDNFNSNKWLFIGFIHNTQLSSKGKYRKVRIQKRPRNSSQSVLIHPFLIQLLFWFLKETIISPPSMEALLLFWLGSKSRVLWIPLRSKNSPAPTYELLLPFCLANTLEPQISEVRRKMWKSFMRLTGTLVDPPQAHSGDPGWLTGSTEKRYCIAGIPLLHEIPVTSEFCSGTIGDKKCIQASHLEYRLSLWLHYQRTC